MVVYLVCQNTDTPMTAPSPLVVAKPHASPLEVCLLRVEA